MTTNAQLSPQYKTTEKWWLILKDAYDRQIIVYAQLGIDSIKCIIVKREPAIEIHLGLNIKEDVSKVKSNLDFFGLYAKYAHWAMINNYYIYYGHKNINDDIQRTTSER